MQKVAIVTDTIACLPLEMVRQYQLRILPINLYFGDKIYREWIDITPTEAYELFLKNPEHFKTSAPSPTVCLEAYREASKRATNILCVTVSSKLSMVYDSARLAKEQAENELPGTTIEILDSRTATAAEGFVALAGARAAEEGKSLPEVVKAAEEMRDKVSVVVLLDTIRYVYRSGRIPKVAARAGSVLNIKPIFTISGVVNFAGVVRSKESGIERLLKTMRDKVGLSPVHVAVMHAYALDEAERLKERIASEFNCSELWLSEFSPVMGYACGTGTLAVAFYSGE
ncbi:Protein DegV [subsurface metagenome]